MIFVLILLGFLIFIVMLCGKTLIRIRDEIRYGLVCKSLDDFLRLLEQADRKTVFKKRLRSVGMPMVYSVVIDGNRYSFFSSSEFDERLDSGFRIVERSFKPIR